MGRRKPEKQMLLTVLRAQFTVHVDVFDSLRRRRIFGKGERFRRRRTRTFDQRYHGSDEENVRYDERKFVRGTNHELTSGVCTNDEFSFDGGVEESGERVFVERV